MRQKLDNANYDSIADFLQSLQTCTNPDNAETTKEFTETGLHAGNGLYGNCWYGADCRTGLDVQAKMRDGWQEGRDRMNDLRSQIGTVDLVPVDRRRRKVRADSGDHLDMTAVYAGRLDIAWTVARRVSTTGPQKIELCANMICSASEHADVLFWRGAAATVLADLLETAGYMVRLVVCFGGTCSGQAVSCRITVKEHGMPLDVTSTSATILPGFFRALGHGWTAAHHPDNIWSPSMSVKQGNVEPGELLLSHSVRDHGTALAYVNDTIAKLNAGQLAA